MRGALILYIIFGEPSGFEWEIPKSCFTKRKRQISEGVPFIHFDLPGPFSDVCCREAITLIYH